MGMPNVEERYEIVEKRKCPVCGKEPILRFFNYEKKCWIYKHVKKVGKKYDFSRRAIVESYYHEGPKLK